MELRNLVSSLEYLVSNGGQVLLGGIRLGDSATGAGLEAGRDSEGGGEAWRR